jgi:hypothetical protein
MSRATLVGAGIALLTVLLPPNSIAAQEAASNLWGVDGSVSAVSRIGNTLYIGGGFTTVGPNTGGGVPVGRVTGEPRVPFARVAGRVSAVLSDGAGGWYIGGHFRAVEGVPRRNLAHVLADGTVSPWNPDVAGVDGAIDWPSYEARPAGVSALELQGRTLYVGGRFSTVGAIERHNLAAIDVTTGRLTGWNPIADDEVQCFAVKGNIVYVGGVFHRVGGLERNCIAAIDARSGQVTPWNPDAEQRVRSLAVDGRTVFAGGDFISIGGEPRAILAALDATTGRATAWNAELGPPREAFPLFNWIWPFVSTLAVRGHTLYAGGSFNRAGVEPRFGLAAFDTRSGAVTAFAPRLDGRVHALVLRGNLVYAGGDWYNVEGVPVPHVAAFDGATGDPTSWSPRANGLVEALAVDDASVYIGGSFNSLRDWQLRNGLAAFDLVSGRATDWDPRIDGYRVRCLSAVGDTLYMTGWFKGVGGQTRNNIAAVDARTGAVTSWDPGGGWRLRAQGRSVYVMGHRGTPRYFARLDPVTAAPAPFDAQLDGFVDDFLEVGDTIYLAGSFVRVGGQFRPFLAAVDATTGQLLPWNPEANPEERVFSGVRVFAARGNTIYLGGNFTGPSWFPRTDLAAVDGTTGALLPWDPHPAGEDFWSQETHVEALTVRDDEVWVGGDFNRIGGQPRANLAVLDATTGTPSPLRFDPDGVVETIATSGDTVYVGGGFRSFGVWPVGGIAAVVMPREERRAAAMAPASHAAAVALSIDPCRPNPLRAGGVLGFTLPHPGPVRLTVHDAQGRRVATILDGQSRAAGHHEAPIRTARWAAGVYFSRLEASGQVATRKFIVVD